MNLSCVLQANAEKTPQRTAIRCRGEALSYQQAWETTLQIAQYLHDAGIRNGDRIGLSLAESALHLLAHYAIARLSAVIVPMDHRWTQTEKLSAAQTFNTKLVLIEDGAEELDGIDSLILSNASLPVDVSSLPTVDESDSTLLLSLSSGTTGKPKGALINHRHLYERFYSQWQAIGYGARDTFAVTTPFYFGAGRSFGMSLLAAGGCVLIAPPPLKPEQLLKILSDKSVTATFLPPTLLRRLFALVNNDSDPVLGNIQYLIASGEPLFADEARECARKICPNLYSYYASSEGGGISILSPEDVAEFAQTVGKPTYKTEVQIVNDDDEELPIDSVGRLRYRGPGVSTRFLDSDGKEHDLAVGGWFYPGDLAEHLSSGHIALRGRDKDVIIRGGVNIYPAEIESILLKHDAILEAAVVGVDDKGRGQTLKAFLVTDGKVKLNDLESWMSNRLAPYKRPQETIELSTLPKSNSGKIDKKALTEL